MQRLRTVTLLDVSAVAGHHAMPAALLLKTVTLTDEFLSRGTRVKDMLLVKIT